MTLLHFALPGNGSVHGHEFTDHLAEIPAELVADVLTNPLWREATHEEQVAFQAARGTADTIARKPVRKKVSNG